MPLKIWCLNRFCVQTPMPGNLMEIYGGSCANLLRLLQLTQTDFPQVQFCCSRENKQNYRKTLFILLSSRSYLLFQSADHFLNFPYVAEFWERLSLSCFIAVKTNPLQGKSSDEKCKRLSHWRSSNWRWGSIFFLHL